MKSLDDLKVIYKAKCLLIAEKGMTEEESHHYIEKEAMNLRLTNARLRNEFWPFINEVCDGKNDGKNGAKTRERKYGSPGTDLYFTNVVMYPLNPRKEDFRISDIAHALSLMTRANGHFLHFYSVAQHCLNCSYEAEARGYSRRMQLALLLHDASEAYLSDVTRPVKAGMPRYREIEAHLSESFLMPLAFFTLRKKRRKCFVKLMTI